MENFKEIIQSLNSAEDVDMLLNEIDRLLQGIYEKGNNNFDNVMQEYVRIGVAQRLKESITRSGLGVEEYLKKLRIEVEKLKVVKLTLAFEPSQAAITRIAQWVKQNISNYTIVEHSFDKDIVGGVIVEYEGKYHDYSLRKNFNQMIKEKKGELLNLIDNQANNENG